MSPSDIPPIGPPLGADPTDPGDPGQDGAWLAAEYAVGLLSGQALLHARARETQDPSFAAEVQDWRERLQPLLDALPEATPSAELWPRIRAALAREGQGAAEPTPFVRPAASGRLGRRPRLWGAGLVAAGVAALAVLVGVRSWQVNEPVLTAVLAAPAEQGGAPVFKARLEPRRKRVVITAVASASPKDRDKARELWIIPEGGKPLPAGLIDLAHPSPLPLDATLLAQAKAKAVLAVTLEPAGGAPLGAPTGPVIAAGPLAGA